MSGWQNLEVHSSCGVKKIIDCKVSENGKLVYKVKWEATWEPEENLSICSHLVNDFWSYVNRVTTEQKSSQGPSRKRSHLDSDAIICPSLTPASERSHVVPLGRTLNSGASMLPPCRPVLTDAGGAWQHIFSSSQISPSPLVSFTTAQAVDSTTPDFEAAHASCSGKDPWPPSQMRTPKKTKKANLQEIKPEVDDIKSGSSTSAFDGSTLPTAASRMSLENLPSSSLQYLENFTNPYVKIVLLCRVCNKEQSMKKPGNWKAHYMIHVSDDEKPYKCSTCGKAFIRQDVMKTHMEKQHGILT